MKPLLFSLLFLLTPKMGISQVSEKNELILSPTDKFYYLDSTSVQTNSKNYVYIRVIKDSKLKKESYVVQEYYRSGSLRMQGTSKAYDGYSKEGKAAYYYKNGSKKSEGEFIEDKKNQFSQYKINQFWDVNGVQKVTDGNGFYEDQEENEFSRGQLKNGLKDGIWEGWVKNPENKYSEEYNNGKLVLGTILDENNIKSTYTVLEKKPEPKNGMEAFYRYIARNFKYPAYPDRIHGRIYILFTVDKDGKIVDPKILRDVGYGTGEQVIQILSSYNGFAPGEQRGQKVKSKYTLPISI